jgi:hypothetical protein
MALIPIGQPTCASRPRRLGCDPLCASRAAIHHRHDVGETSSGHGLVADSCGVFCLVGWSAAQRGGEGDDEYGVGPRLTSDREGSAAAKDDEAVIEQFAKLCAEGALRLADCRHSLDVDVRGHVEDVPSSVELRWRPVVRQAATTCSSCTAGATVPAISASSAARSFGRCRWPLTRRNCLPASSMPAAHQRSAICPSRQRLTLRA